MVPYLSRIEGPPPKNATVARQMRVREKWPGVRIPPGVHQGTLKIEAKMSNLVSENHVPM